MRVSRPHRLLTKLHQLLLSATTLHLALYKLVPQEREQRGGERGTEENDEGETETGASERERKREAAADEDEEDPQRHPKKT
jgi:hypothetical protein